MKVATLTGSDIHVSGWSITGFVTLLAALVSATTTITTVALDWNKERSKTEISARDAEVARQAAELQRLQLALSLNDADARRHSIRLLIRAGLLRDPEKKLEETPAIELPLWPAPKSTPGAPSAPDNPAAATQKPQLPGGIRP